MVIPGMSEPVSCPLCSHSSRFAFSKEGYSLYRCMDCGFIYVFPFLNSEELASFYQQDYYELDNERYHPVNQYVTKKWEQRLSIIQQYLDKPEKSLEGISILDVGCATGVFLERAVQHGMVVSGIEHAEYAVKQAESRLGPGRVYQGEFLHYNANNQFSVLTAWDVIEHVGDPIGFLKKANAMLADGGVLCLSTVNTDAYHYRLFKKNWRYVIPPEHLSYFNPGNMALALEACGFELLDMRTRYVYQAFLDGVSPQARHITRSVSPILKGFLYLPKLVAEHKGKGDTLEIWARKKVTL